LTVLGTEGSSGDRQWSLAIPTVDRLLADNPSANYFMLLEDTTHVNVKALCDFLSGQRGAGSAQQMLSVSGVLADETPSIVHHYQVPRQNYASLEAGWLLSSAALRAGNVRFIWRRSCR
jgi:hypothetical protein